MRKIHSLGFCTLLAPVMMLGAGPALADEDRATQRGEQMQQHVPEATQPRTTTPEGQPGLDPMRQRGQDAPGRMQQPGAATRPGQQQAMRDGFLASVPAGGIRADDLIGSNIRSRADNSNIGSVSDIVIDQDGRVVAVIVGVGGFLGLGQKDVAIGWDAIQRTQKRTGRGYDYFIDASEESLRNAPTFRAD